MNRIMKIVPAVLAVFFIAAMVLYGFFNIFFPEWFSFYYLLGGLGFSIILAVTLAVIDRNLSEKRKTPFYKACLEGNSEKAASFLRNGFLTNLFMSPIDLNAPDELKPKGIHDTLLYRTAASGHAGVVKLLIENGARVNAFFYGAESALGVAVKKGRTDVVRVLLEAGAEIDDSYSKENRPMLFDAMENGHIDVVRLLIENGVDINNVTYLGDVPLVFAVENELVDMAELLLENGADLNGEGGETILYTAVQTGRADMVELLIDNGVDIAATDYNGRTALHIAAEDGRVDMAEMLINNGADVNATDSEGRTALMTAYHFGRTEVAKMLIARGAVVSEVEEEIERNISRSDYPTIKIGDQLWMKFNFNEAAVEYSEFENPIYTHEEAVRLCPEGWRLPSLWDFDQLFESIDTIDDLLYGDGKSGFGAVPTGTINGGGWKLRIDFWTSTEASWADYPGQFALFSLWQKDNHQWEKVDCESMPEFKYPVRYIYNGNGRAESVDKDEEKESVFAKNFDEMMELAGFREIYNRDLNRLRELAGENRLANTLMTIGKSSTETKKPNPDVVDILKSFYLHGNELGEEMLDRTLNAIADEFGSEAGEDLLINIKAC